MQQLVDSSSSKGGGSKVTCSDTEQDGERATSLNEDDYDGDDNVDSTEDSEPSDDNDHQPVVTFLDVARDLSHSEAPSISHGYAGPGVGSRTSSTPNIGGYHRQPSSASRHGLLGRRTKSKRSLRMRVALNSHARSRSSASQLGARSQSTLSPRGPSASSPPSDSPGHASPSNADASPGKAGRACTDSENLGHLYSQAHPQPSLLDRSPTAARWAESAHSHVFPRRREHHTHRRYLSEAGESPSTPEQLGFPRAHTFSVHYPHGEPGIHNDSAGLVDPTHSLPRMLTQSSVKEKDGGDMETGIDDLPPLALGREITNDLRRIELSFSEEPEAKRRASNPLKHLIKSRHNFRALVSYGGYLIPINILLNVMLLGRGWLQYDIPNSNGNKQTVNNPVGYLILSIITLILIVISGGCFVLRCLEFNVLKTTMTSIIANFMNAVLILASALMYKSREAPRHPDAHLTGEYYSSFGGAAVALLNALLLLLDMLITPGFRYRGSGMSKQQRMLQFNIILVVVWIGVGGYVWSKIEDWDTITSIMFCIVTVTTIGFGNKSPTKTYSRILQLIYGPLGILMFGLMLLHTRNVIIQITRTKLTSAKRQIEAKRRRIEQEVTLSHVKRRLAARPQHRGWKDLFAGALGRIFLSRRRRIRIGIPHWLRSRIDQGSDDDNLGDGLDARQRKGTYGPAARSTDLLDADRAFTGQTLGSPHQIPGIHGAAAVPDIQLLDRPQSTTHSRSSSDNDRAPLPMERSYTTASRLSQVRQAILRPGFWENMRSRIRHRRNEGAERDIESGKRSGLNQQQHSEGEESGHATDAKSGGQRKGTKQSKRSRKLSATWDSTRQLWVALVLNICFWCISAAVFYALESSAWSYFDAMWFCYVAFTTIGYGDIVPNTTKGEIAFICLCFIAVGLETFLVVSGVTFFSDLLKRGMRRTNVQERIEKRRRRLVAYEIRQHIKHPNYNPFSHGDEDRAVSIGVTRLRRAGRNICDALKDKKSLKGMFKRQQAADEPSLDHVLTEEFIRHATGMSGFAPTSWQTPSPLVSPSIGGPSSLFDQPQAPSPRISRASLQLSPDASPARHEGNEKSNQGAESSSSANDMSDNAAALQLSSATPAREPTDSPSSGIHIRPRLLSR